MKQKIRVTIGILLLISCFAGLLYFNCWSALISPFIEICKALNTHMITAELIGSLVIKNVFYNFIGSVTFIIGYYLGMFLVFNETD